MKIQIECYKRKHTVETETDDYNIEEYLDFIIGLLLQVGFHKESINNAIVELAEELKEEK
jgi:hypothetical protein